MADQVTAKMYAEVFGTGNGPAVLEDILREGFVWYRSGKGQPVDEDASIFRDGARSLALLIREKVHQGRGLNAPADTHALTNVKTLKEATP